MQPVEIQKQHKGPYTVEQMAKFILIKKNVYNLYIIILEEKIQLRNHTFNVTADNKNLERKQIKFDCRYSPNLSHFAFRLKYLSKALTTSDIES